MDNFTVHNLSCDAPLEFDLTVDYVARLDQLPALAERKSFLTGSRQYGTPRPDSDYDLVIRCTQRDAAALAGLDRCNWDPDWGDKVGDGENDVDAHGRRTYGDNSSELIEAPGGLHIICCFKDIVYLDWLEGTRVLLSRAPVTREDAKAEFAARRLREKQICDSCGQPFYVDTAFRDACEKPYCSAICRG